MLLESAMLRARPLANLAAVLVATACAQPFSRAEESAEVVLENQRGRSRIAITGLATETVQAMESATLDVDAWRAVFAVRVDAGTGDDVPAMLGDYRIDSGRVVFEPRFPLRAGLGYRVDFDTSRRTAREPAQILHPVFCADGPRRGIRPGPPAPAEW
jgi:hypothetical protein